MRNRFTAPALAIGLLAAASGPFAAAAKADAMQAPEPTSRLTSAIIGANGDRIGMATIQDGPNGIVMTVEIKRDGLTPGPHGIHLHRVGTCADVGEFTRSKGHIDPNAVQHGLLNPAGPEPGDLPNLQVGRDGAAHQSFFNNRVRLDHPRGPALLDDDGSAIIIHRRPDDHMSQPIGGAGPRVACAEIVRAKAM